MKKIQVAPFLLSFLLMMVTSSFGTPAGQADDHGDDLISGTIVEPQRITDESLDEIVYTGGKIDHVEDRDFFCFEIVQKVWLSVHLYNTGIMNADLFDPSGELVNDAKKLPGQLDEHNSTKFDNTLIEKIGLVPGRYCLSLLSSESFPVYYAIALQVQPQEKEDDHGNSPDEASLSENYIVYEGVSGCLENADDVDVFRFEMREYFYSCSNNDSLSFINFKLTDDSGIEKASGPLSQFNTLSYGLLPGTYYLSLSSDNDQNGCYSICIARTTFFQPGGMASGVIFPPNANAEITLSSNSFIGELFYETNTAAWGNSGAWWMTCTAANYEMTIKADGYETVVKNVNVDYGAETQMGGIVLSPLDQTQNECENGAAAVIDDQLNLDFPCVRVGENGYGLRLNYITDTYQFRSFMWSLDLDSFTEVCTDCSDMNCVAPEEELTLSVPCAQFQGMRLGFDLKLNTIACPEGSFCWELDTKSLH